MQVGFRIQGRGVYLEKTLDLPAVPRAGDLVTPDEQSGAFYVDHVAWSLGWVCVIALSKADDLVDVAASGGWLGRPTL
jgi:hypothetical protein